jgi:hypothetical protein
MSYHASLSPDSNFRGTGINYVGGFFWGGFGGVMLVLIEFFDLDFDWKEYLFFVLFWRFLAGLAELGG